MTGSFFTGDAEYVAPSAEFAGARPVIHPAPEQAAELRKLASGKACPAGTGGVLERIAANHAVTRGLVRAYTRTREESTNFYARLRAAGFELSDAGGTALPPADADPNGIVTLAPVRPEVQTAARAYAATMDRAAEDIAAADREYARALGWAG